LHQKLLKSSGVHASVMVTKKMVVTSELASCEVFGRKESVLVMVWAPYGLVSFLQAGNWVAGSCLGGGLC